MAVPFRLKIVPKPVMALMAVFLSMAAFAQRSAGGKMDSIVLSAFNGGFSSFINEAIKSNKVAVIDKDVTPQLPVEINGSIIVVGRNSPVITNIHPVLFLLKEGEHVFQNFDIMQQPGCIAFSTFIKNNLTWTNTIRAVNVTGGRQAYASSRGGLYDAERDSVLQWSGTTIEDCVFKTSYVCVTVFSQDGPAKYLHMRNVDLYCDTAHNLYVHPNVSLRLYNVRSMKVGTPGLAIHHYSGGGGEKGKGVISNARYVEIKRCTTNWDLNMKGGMWQIAEPISGAVIMDSCDLAPYSIPLPRMVATNTRFFNGGGGAYVKGRIMNCNGTVWPTDSTVVTGGHFDEINLRPGGKTIIKNAIIKDVWGDRNAYYPVFQNCSIENMNLAAPYGKVVLRKTKLKKSRVPLEAGKVIFTEN